MNNETWERIRALQEQIDRFKRDTSIADSEQTAAGKMQERWGIDTEPCIAHMLANGGVYPFLYYRSNEWIHQPIELQDQGIVAYSGPLSDAPLELYGPGTFIVDTKITSFHRKIIGGYSQSALENTQLHSRKINRTSRRNI